MTDLNHVTPKRLLPHVKLVRERGTLPVRGLTVRAPEDAAGILRAIIGSEEVEVFVILHLDVRSRVTGYTEITRGLLNASLVHPREAFRAAIVANAAAIVLAHNHPSGDTEPSAEDRSVTRQLVAAGQLLDIPVFDHIIIAGDRHLSFAVAGLL